MTEDVDDLRLPPGVVAKIMKDSLPPGTIVSKDARIAVTRAAAVFVLNMTTYANEYATSRKRKLVTAEDVLHALHVLECDHIQKPLKDALEVWENKRKEKNAQIRKKRAERKSAASAGVSAGGAEGAEMEIEQEQETQSAGENSPFKQVSPNKSPSKRTSLDSTLALRDIEDA